MKHKWLFWLAFLLCLSVFLFSGYQILSTAMGYREGEIAYDSIQQYVEMTPPTDAYPDSADSPDQHPGASTPTGEDAQTDIAPKPSVIFPKVDFDTLHSINTDVVAWIYIEDTVISYPVVQGEDNDQYLSVMFDGTRNAAGSIFLDYRNEPDFTDQNTVLHGHHMKNGSMFAGISKYRTQDYYDSHPYILIMTPDVNYRYHVIAGYVASLSDPAWKMEFTSDEELQDWIDRAISRSGFVSAVTANPRDRFLTLSTCSYEFNDARFILIGVLTDFELKPEHEASVIG